MPTLQLSRQSAKNNNNIIVAGQVSDANDESITVTNSVGNFTFEMSTKSPSGSWVQLGTLPFAFDPDASSVFSASASTVTTLVGMKVSKNQTYKMAVYGSIASAAADWYKLVCNNGALGDEDANVIVVGSGSRE